MVPCERSCHKEYTWQCPPNSSDRRTERTKVRSVRFARCLAGPVCQMLVPSLCMLLRISADRWSLVSACTI